MNKAPAPTSSGRAIVSVVCAAPFITENGKVSPLVPVAIIDRESDAGSYADALAHSVNIKQSDFVNHLPDLTDKP